MEKTEKSRILCKIKVEKSLKKEKEKEDKT